MGPPSVPRGRADRGGQSQPASIERRLLRRLTEAIEARHFSPRTEKAYRGWVRRFLQFQDGNNPLEMGSEEISQFLSRLAVVRRVSSSTQNQALCALLFFYKEVLGREIEGLPGLIRAKMQRRLPVVLTREEVEAPFHGFRTFIGCKPCCCTEAD